jgi:hypothetical protein
MLPRTIKSILACHFSRITSATHQPLKNGQSNFQDVSLRCKNNLASKKINCVWSTGKEMAPPGAEFCGVEKIS